MDWPIFKMSPSRTVTFDSFRKASRSSLARPGSFSIAISRPAFFCRAWSAFRALVPVLEQYRLGRERRLRLFLPLCVDLLENSGLVVLRAGVFLYEEPQYYTVLVKRRYLDSVLSSSKIRFATIF